MPLPELTSPPMRRVALVAAEPDFRAVAVAVADLGTFEPDAEHGHTAGPVATEVDRAVARHAPAHTPPAELSPTPIAADQIAGLLDPRSRDHDHDDDDADADAETGLALALALGEASFEVRTAAAHEIRGCRVLPGWIRAGDLDACRGAVAGLGGAVVDLPGRRGLAPPTATGAGRTTAAFRPLVTTYATVPYRDVDPTWFATFAYLLMFGMMFGDVGHGLLIAAMGVTVAVARPTGRLAPVARFHRAAPFLVGAGISSIVFGFLYGEAFGPTGLVPTLWMRPLEHPGTLLLTGLGVGAALLALTFVGAIVNRWRAGGLARALYDPAGIAGALILLGAGVVTFGVVSDAGWATAAGWVVVAAGGLLVFVGLFVGAGARPSALAQAVIELFDAVLGLGSNLVSFTRLAAFGLTHAVIGEVVWDGTTALWDGGPASRAAAVVLFVGGNAIAFALGALVAAIQALRLEYYELFSRLFSGTGRPFDPWHVPTRRWEAS